ncbi:hypothetical protein Pan44_46620 [Caulifigura coniformis]|uniref:Uncharacterized protein n=1 Tax=Caulifigura coniformis TaxID=2527983 RepID=A0A517SKF4_9PLAN|nr:hypothetical protein [Caulifigura coniformis]QDT56605.1 hypothetical protein Pan44_46620 [Caulifigura coniformis]
MDTAETPSNLSSSGQSDSTIRKYKAAGLLYMVMGTTVVCQQFSSQGSLIAMAFALFLIPCGIWMVVHADRMLLQLIRAEVRLASRV